MTVGRRGAGAPDTIVNSYPYLPMSLLNLLFSPRLSVASLGVWGGFGWEFRRGYRVGLRQKYCVSSRSELSLL